METYVDFFVPISNRKQVVIHLQYPAKNMHNKDGI